MVDFFFVLSGFVIAHAYYNRLNDEGLVGIFFFRHRPDMAMADAELLYCRDNPVDAANRSDGCMTIR
jgi:hypothetical protein